MAKIQPIPDFSEVVAPRTKMVPPEIAPSPELSTIPHEPSPVIEPRRPGERARAYTPTPPSVQESATAPALPDHLTIRKTVLAEPMVALNARVRSSVREQLRLRSLQTGVPVQDILTRLIDEYLKQPLR